MKYIIRTAVKNVGHRRLLILCLYARGNTPGDRPRLAYTMFQASNGFVTYDHQPDTKTVWRTAMLENLEQDYQFLTGKCAFYSKPDEVRVINFCKAYPSETGSRHPRAAAAPYSADGRPSAHRGIFHMGEYE